MDVGPAIGALRRRLQDMARSEMARQRNRLGSLTQEQETAIEKLLISTVNKLSHPLMDRMRRSYDDGDVDDLQAWREIFDLDDSPPDQ